MKIIINGEPNEIPDDLSLTALLENLKLNPETIAVEKNEKIIERKDYSSEKINEGDTLELIRFMGGG